MGKRHSWASISSHRDSRRAGVERLTDSNGLGAELEDQLREAPIADLETSEAFREVLSLVEYVEGSLFSQFVILTDVAFLGQ